MRARLVRVGGAQVDPIELGGPAVGVIEAQQQLEHGGLSRARRADQRDGLAGLDAEAETLERRDLGARRIVERDVVELDRAGRRLGQRSRLRRRGDLRLRRQQLDQPPGRPRRALHLTDHLAQRADRAGHHHGVEDEGRELAGADPAGDDVVAADPQDRADGAEHGDDDDGAEQGVHPHPPDGGGEGLLDPHAEAAALVRLAAERLHRAHRADGFVDVGGDVGDLVLAQPRQTPHAAAEEDQRQHDAQHDQEHHASQLRAGDRQQDRAANQQQQVAQRHRRGGAEDRLQHGGVGDQPRQDLTRPGGLEEGRAEADDVAVDGAADVGDDALADPRDEEVAAVAGGGEQGDNAEHDDQRLVEQRRNGAAKALVDQPAQPEAEGEHRARRGSQRDQRPGDRQLVGLEEANDLAELAEIAARRPVARRGGGALGAVAHHRPVPPAGEPARWLKTGVGPGLGALRRLGSTVMRCALRRCAA